MGITRQQQQQQQHFLFFSFSPSQSSSSSCGGLTECLPPSVCVQLCSRYHRMQLNSILCRTDDDIQTHSTENYRTAVAQNRRRDVSSSLSHFSLFLVCVYSLVRSFVGSFVRPRRRRRRILIRAERDGGAATRRFDSTREDKQRNEQQQCKNVFFFFFSC